MREYIFNIMEQSGSLNVEDIIFRLLAGVVVSMAIYISYWYTHAGTAYSKKFNVSLLTLGVLTTIVMTVIGNNIALSLGMVGALSIVRFRTAVKDSRDTTYIFWAIIVGISCGSGDYVIAGVGTAVVFIILLILGRVRNENRILLIIKASSNKEREIEGIIMDVFNSKAVLRVKNTTPDSLEIIYELSRKVYELSNKQSKPITEMIYNVGGVEYVNVVVQSDEING